MSKKYPKRTVYFNDFTDDFAGEGLKEKKIDKDYRYVRRGFFWRFSAFILHRVIAPPIAFLYSKLWLREKIIDRKKLKGHKSYILYGNHTQMIGDAFTPNIVAYPKRTYVVVHPDNLTLPLIGKITPMLGALPIPSSLRAAKNYSDAIAERLSEGRAVAIFPEAHTWPYYTGIRPFNPSAFDAAVRNSVPCFAVTRVYKKMKVFGFRCEIYVDGPFYADEGLSRADAGAELGRLIHEVMEERANLSDVEVIEYRRKV